MNSKLELSAEAATVWNAATDFERIRIRLALHKIVLQHLRGHGGDFLTAADRIAIAGTVGPNGSGLRVTRLERRPELPAKGILSALETPRRR